MLKTDKVKSKDAFAETIARSLPWRKPESGYDLHLREMALAAIQTQTFAGSPLLELRGAEAEHAMDVIQRVR